MFMLIMQFFWKYIDDLMGKGLEVIVLLELLFYVSASLIPLALPLAMLLSSIMTLGNLAENNELTALKSAGLSLYRILRPLTVVVLVICLGTFYFANYVIPVANLKWRSLIYDIQETKITSILTPGKYNKELDGYAIKIDKGTESSFTNIVIHDYNDISIVKTVKADSGEVYKSKNGSYLFFKLYNGNVMEELNVNSILAGNINKKDGSFLPSRRTRFKEATYKIDLSGFKLNRSDEDLFKNTHEMLNVFQLNEAVDSVQKQSRGIVNNFLESIKNDHPYFQALTYIKNSKNDEGILPNQPKAKDTSFLLSDLSQPERIIALQNSISRIRRKNENLSGQMEFMKASEADLGRYFIEFHRKFALTAAILVLFFVGAPLGAIVRKGGFGAPVVIAALLFMIYFVLISIGENLATTGVVSPFFGMWMATFVLLPLAFILMKSAANDSQVFNTERFSNFFQRFKKKKGKLNV
jgi:lipopolysaccharide export system permease protein